jgi:hypothetical protein
MRLLVSTNKAYQHLFLKMKELLQDEKSSLTKIQPVHVTYNPQEGAQ